MEKPLVTVATKYSYERLITFHKQHFRRLFKLLFWITIACNIVLIILMGARHLSIGFDEDGMWQTILIMIAINLLYVFLTIAMPQIISKKTPLLNGTNTTTFSDLGMNTGYDVEEDNYIKGEDIYRVVETTTDFYVYLSRHRALILDKNGITAGSLDELRDWFTINVSDEKLQIMK